MPETTEEFWHRVQEEWGLLRTAEVALLLGVGTADEKIGGRIIGVKRGWKQAYPGFQFDLKTGSILAVIPPLVALAREISMDDEDLVFWLCTPSGYFGGDRPVDHLDAQDELLEKLRLGASARR